MGAAVPPAALKAGGLSAAATTAPLRTDNNTRIHSVHQTRAHGLPHLHQHRQAVGDDLHVRVAGQQPPHALHHACSNSNAIMGVV